MKVFEKDGIKPTLRTIFYRLTPNIIDNFQGDYTYLSKKTAEYRKRSIILRRFDPEKNKGVELSKERFDILKSHQLLKVYKKNRCYQINPTIVYYNKGGDFVDQTQKYFLDTDKTLPIDCFSDETRGEYDKFIHEYKTPAEYVENSVNFISKLPSEYKELIPKWHNQKYHVELWTEKNAMIGTFISMLRDWKIRIVYNRGFDSMAHAWNTYLRLRQAWERQKKVRILYCGDLDPSGDAMDEIINEFMNVCFDVKEYKKRGLYDFKRIGVLYEHIEKYHLEKNPDPKILDKLKEDPRKEKFKAKYGIGPGEETDRELFQVEIDSLAAEAPLELKKMLVDHIRTYYDELTYTNLLRDENHSDGQISQHVIKYVQPLLQEFNIRLMWQWLESN